jgi:prepilin signal peptidase PulO-like enzyme (type II secretory pathway)
MLIVFLLLLGLACGSFVNALVWRLHEQSQLKSKSKKSKAELSILKGRSMCPHCRHNLAWYDLIPLVSWLWLHGECRYCQRSISAHYPLVEALSAVVFAGSYIFWPETVHLGGQWLLLTTWLVCSVGLLGLAVYDLRWMLLPSRIIYPTLAAAVAGRAAYIIFFDNRPGRSLLLWALSVLVASGVFFVLFTISKGKWIGYGDVRLGLVTGTLLADPTKSLAMIFFASVLGTAVILPALLSGQKKLASKLPYGPFLIAAAAFVLLFGQPVIDWYKNLII